MSKSKSAFADGASNLTRLLSADPEFQEYVFRTLKPLTLSLAAIFSIFVLLGLIDSSAGDARFLIVITDVVATFVFLGIYLSLSAGLVPFALTYPLGFFIACVPLANTLLAFGLTSSPFFLSYLPMIAIVCGAYMLSLPWLLAMLTMIFGATFVVASEVLPIVTIFRYSPALIGAYLVSLLVFFTRRWHIIESHRALLAQKNEAEERKRVESQLAHAQRLESIGKLVSGIAHDFNNLLTVIVGYTDSLLETTKPNTALHADLREIQGAGEKAAALAQNLLAFSRQQLMELRVVAVNEFIGDAEALISRSMPSNVTLCLALNAEDARVAVDPLQMEQVLINLALNARDAMAESGGNLTIETALVETSDAGAMGATRGLVEIRMTDTGCGMPDDVRNRVFEPFFTTKERGAGTGLGLAMAHGIVTQCGGTIDIETRAGHGTTCIIRLPQVVAPVEKPAAGPAPKMECANLTGRTVLVVDDERAVREIVSRVLQHYGCKVLSAASGDEAIELAAQASFDVLLTDVSMPGISGVELLATLRSRGYSQPALLMSGHAADKVAREGGDATPVLHKPFKAEELALKVSHTLGTTEEKLVSANAGATESVQSHSKSKHDERGPLRVLLIDDHAALLKIVADMVRVLGHECIACRDPAEAKDILRRENERLDVVITDYSMPGVSGGEILELCRRDYPHLHTILSTGYDEHDANALATGKGADGLLMKPPRPHTLAAALDKAYKK
ncbi:MAG: response regulator [Woeseia sp.]|nr:response regulator [Woeseia sp.]